MRNRRGNQEIENGDIVVNLAELFLALWSKIHIILLSGILMALLVFIGTKLFITPLYTSVTKVYVLSKEDNNANITYNDLQTGTQLSKDYIELVKSRPVLEQVIAVLNLDMETGELAEMITAETQTDTRIITIRVENESPKLAKEIADAARESVAIQITEIMDVDSVNTVEDGSLPKEPSSPNVMRNLMIGGIIGVLLAAGIIILFFMLDDTIKTPDDVEKYLELSVLTSIPLQESSGKPKRGKKEGKKKTMKNAKSK